METRLRTGSWFYSTCLSPELHPIVPDLINSTPGSSVNFHIVDIFTKSCISSNNLITLHTQRHTEFHFFPQRSALKKGYDTQQYAATKPDSFSNIQIRETCFQKYYILSQYCLIKFHKVLRLFYDFRAFISTWRDYSSWLSSSSNWIAEFVHAVPLHYWPHAGEHSRPCLRQVHPYAGTIWRAVTPYHLQKRLRCGKSSEGVPGLPSPSIHSPPMTCLRFRLSIASLAGTLLDYDAGLLLTSEEDSEAAFENYWSSVSHSSVGSACSLVSPQVFFRRGIPAKFSCYHNIIDCMWKGSENFCLLSEV